MVIGIIEDWPQARSSDGEALRRLDENRVPNAPVLSVEQAMNHPQLRARRGRVDDFDIDALHVTGSREVVASPDCIGAGLPRFDQRDDVRLVAGCAGPQPLPTPGGLLAGFLVRSAILP